MATTATRRRRRRALGIVAVAALVAGVAAGADVGGDDRGRDDVAVLDGAPMDERLRAAADAVDRLAREEEGQVGVALAPLWDGRVQTGGELQEGRAWSAIKVPLVAAFLRFRAEQVGGDTGSAALSRRDGDLIEGALTRSDNDAASDLYAEMVRVDGEPGVRRRLQSELTEAGDSRTVIATMREGGRTAYGTTRWRLEDALNYFRQLARGCVLGAADTLLILSTLSDVVRAQRWGVPRAVGAETPVAFKGGWGPGNDLRWLVEQVAVVGRGGQAYVVALMARTPVRARSRADPRSYYAARRLLERAARAVHAAVGPPGSSPAAPPGEC